MASNSQENIPGIAKVSEEQLGSYNKNYNAHRVGIPLEEVVQYYNSWTTYDQDLGPEIYHGPVYAAQYVQKYMNTDLNGRILDVAAGTGRVAIELHKVNFCNIDALEPARELLEKSPHKHLYKNCIFAPLGEETILELKNDTYDAVVVSGGFGEGHIPCTGLNEMIRVVKPGGFVIIAMREEYLSYVKEYLNRLEPYMAELQDAGKWKRLARVNMQNYSFKKNGLVHVFQVTESGYQAFVSKVV